MNYVPAKKFCSAAQIANLQKLLNFLKSGESKPSFDMRSFSSAYPKPGLRLAWKFLTYNYNTKVSLSPLEVRNECGTICCLAGHGPLAGVEPLKAERWLNYVDRVFTSDFDVFTFLFDSGWVNYQPTKEQAIFRLELFLKKGLPENFFREEDLEVWEQQVDFTNDCMIGLHTLG